MKALKSAIVVAFAYLLMVTYANAHYFSGNEHLIKQAYLNVSDKSVGNTADTGHHISVKVKPFKNQKVYLCTYFGSYKMKGIVDSALLNDKSEGVFDGKRLTSGIYFVVSPAYSYLFDLLIGNQQHFKIAADSSDKDHPVITGSPDNEIYKRYTQKAFENGTLISRYEVAYKSAKTKADSQSAKEKVIAINKKFTDFKDSLIAQNPDALLSMLLAAMRMPEVPAIPVVNGKADSAYPYHFVKDHFWDDVNLFDDRLLRTPFLDAKVDEYFKQYVSPEPDSIIKEVKYMLLSARTGKEMYPYLLIKFTNKYINPEFMGQDKVFVYLFEHFYLKGDTTYLNKESKKTIIDQGYTKISNVIGNAAPLLDIADTTGKTVALNNLKAPYIFVVFWDPGCGHCKEEVPRIDSIYKAKWKTLGVKVYSVDVKDNTVDDYKKFIKDKNLSSDWYYTYQPKEVRDKEAAAGQPNFRQLYDVYKTPTMYLLDEEKHIIAKQLAVLQFDDLLTAKQRNKNAEKKI